MFEFEKIRSIEFSEQGKEKKNWILWIEWNWILLQSRFLTPFMISDFSSSLPQVTIEEPPLPDASAISKTPSPTKNHRTSISMPIKLQQKINRRKSFKRDTSYEDELRRQELLEKRRQKQMALLEKMKSRQGQVGTEVEYIDGAPSFDDCKLLFTNCNEILFWCFKPELWCLWLN